MNEVATIPQSADSAAEAFRIELANERVRNGLLLGVFRLAGISLWHRDDAADARSA